MSKLTQEEKQAMLDDFERIARIGVIAWMAYAITDTLLELARFGGRIAIVGIAAYLAVPWALHTITSIAR